MTKNERFKKALDWLYAEGKVADQRGLSAATDINEATISRIINNKVRQPSSETVRKLTSKFRDIDPAFLRGESDSVTFPQPSATLQSVLIHVKQHEAEPTPVSPAIDSLLELHAQLIRRADDLRQELQQEISAVRTLRQELQTILSYLQCYPEPPATYGRAAEDIK